MRLDNNNPTTLETLKIKADEKDQTIDVCRSCYDSFYFDDDVDHPPYGDGEVTTCFICGDVLDELIDG